MSTTDLGASERGYITITPLTLDITADEMLTTLDDAARVTEFQPTPLPAEPVIDHATMRDAVSAD